MPGNPPPLQDPEAFSILYARTHLVIFRFVYGLHGGPVQEVEDLASETYMRAWRGRSRFRGDEEDAFRWLFTIARHLVIDSHRRRKSHREDDNDKLDDTMLDESFVSPQEKPEELAASREQFKLLWARVLKLPLEKRELLVLRYMLGWQVKQIADHVHMQENTVSVTLRRILEQLRRDFPLT